MFVLQPDIAAMREAGFAYQPHTLIGMLLFAIWPSTRPVHAFTAPIGYLFRPYIVDRSRPGGPASRAPRRAGKGVGDAEPEAVTRRARP